jgi:hypothetical protein
MGSTRSLRATQRSSSEASGEVAGGYQYPSDRKLRNIVMVEVTLTMDSEWGLFNDRENEDQGS